jgi:hypothetical protein
MPPPDSPVTYWPALVAPFVCFLAWLAPASLCFLSHHHHTNSLHRQSLLPWLFNQTASKSALLILHSGGAKFGDKQLLHGITLEAFL